VLDGARADLEATRVRVRALENTRWPADDTLLSQLALTAPSAPAAVLAALEGTLPAEVRLRGLLLAYGRELDVQMRVSARRPEAYDDFLARLGRSRSFRDVVPGVESREGELQATVRARFVGPL
jgi:hypothetical protein